MSEDFFEELVRLREYSVFASKKIKEYEEENIKYKSTLDKIKEIINHYAIENEDYSKIYNQEEKEILELLEEIE